ncbi:MAG: PUR family DNA/RNA-binding protein [Tannerellaceae bacterium]|nr:PUR family DNA/RNA-binding protein [Tannerellaceae bacterium]
MEESMKKTQGESGDKEILYSKSLKAGKRIYYLDVKKNQRDDLFLAITESKKIQPKDGSPSSFEKHKIFLYKEDFDKFLEGMQDIIGYIRKQNELTPEGTEGRKTPRILPKEKTDKDDDGKIKLKIEF